MLAVVNPTAFAAPLPPTPVIDRRPLAERVVALLGPDLTPPDEVDALDAGALRDADDTDDVDAADAGELAAEPAQDPERSSSDLTPEQVDVVAAVRRRRRPFDRRALGVRADTSSGKGRLTAIRAVGLVLAPELAVIDQLRPRTRAECAGGERPCIWVGCKHHLALDVTESGSIKLNFPDREPWELQHSCALDVAERGGLTLEEVGVITNLTRERVRQVEVMGILELKRRRAMREIGPGPFTADRGDEQDGTPATPEVSAA